MTDKGRNVGLDIMRFIAISLVLIHHWVAFNLTLLKTTVSFTKYFSLFGYYGVEIFFVLSGFLIGNIIVKSFINTPKFDLNSIKTFWMRRWLRTLPLYYFILILHIIISLFKHEPQFFVWKYFLFIQNFLGYFNYNNNDFFGESWSLAIEEWFYLSFPLLLILINYFLKKHFSKKSILAYTIFIYIIIPTLVRLSLVFFGDVSWNNVLRKAIICREDSIAYGVIGAYIFYYKKDLFNKNVSKKFINVSMLIGTLFVVFCGIIFSIEVANDYYYHTGNVSFFSKTILFSVVSLGVLLTLPFFYNVTIRSNVISRSIIFVSKISYSLYLTHLFVERVSHKIFVGNSALSIILRLLFFIVGSLILSSITYKYIEETFLKLRDKV